MVDLATAPELLAPLLALAAAAGINLYATGFVTGGIGYLKWVTLPAGLQWLSHPAVLIVFFSLFVLEFFADKIRFVDTVWDLLHTVIRPVGAIALAFGLTKSAPEWTVPLMLLAGTTALATHSAKASISLGLKAAPPVGMNTARSLVEDGVAMGLTWLAFSHPLLAVALLALMLLGFALLAPRLGALALFWIKSPFSALAALAVPPAAPLRRYDAELNKLFGKSLPMPAELKFIHPVYLIRGPGLGFWRRAHLALDGKALAVAKAGFLGLKTASWPLESIHHLKLDSGLLYDTLQVNLPAGRAVLLVHAGPARALAAALAAARPAGVAWELGEAAGAQVAVS